MQLWHFTQRPLPWLDECARRFGDPFTARFPGLGTFVLVSAPDLIKQIFTGDPDVLHAWLRNNDLDLRLRYTAAWLAAVIEDREAVPYLTRILENRTPALDSMAAYALAQLGDPEATAEQVIERMKLDDSLMPSLLIELYRREPENVRPLIEETLRHGTPRTT